LQRRKVGEMRNERGGRRKDRSNRLLAASGRRNPRGNHQELSPSLLLKYPKKKTPHHIGEVN
jgi:hypothetical protein